MPDGRSLKDLFVARYVRRTAGVVVLTLMAGFISVTGITPSAPAQAAVSVTQVGAWNFDAGTGTTAADNAGSHPLTLGTGATWTPGIRGASALAFNGSGTGNASSSGAVLNTATSFSVSAYVKLNNLNGFQTIVSQDGTTNSGFYLQLQDSDRFSFNMEGQDATGSTSVSAFSDVNAVPGYWYHLVGVYNSVAGTSALYVNGRLQSTATKSAAFGTTGNLVVGRAKYNGNTVDYLSGTVDDVRAYSGALTAADVEQISDAAYWKLDEGTGTSAADAGLNGTTATLTNGPTWGTGVKPPYAVQLDGTNDLIDSGKAVVDTSKSFTVALWAQATVTNAVGVVASLDGSNRSAFTLQVGADGKWAFTRPASDTAGATVTSVASTGVAAAGSWHHLVVVYDSVAQTITLYANGTSQASASYTTGWAGTGNFVLGRGKSAAAAASYFAGAVDEVHVYPFAVDAAMVTALAAKPVPPVPAAPTATTSSSTSVSLSWTAPAPVTGADTTGYVVTPYVNGTAGTPQTFNTTATTQTFTGLTTGSSYRYTVAAINSTGTSAPSAQSAAVTPDAVPGTPAAPTATARTQSASVSWTAPGSNGGSAITGYVVTPYIGSTAQTAQTFASTATTQTVTGLTAGTAYTFTVAAQNAAGTGPASTASNAVTSNATPTISSGTPPGGTVGTAYSFTFTVSGGTSPVTWAVSTGSLPAGLSLSSAGVLSGTPTTAASSTFTVRATDASSSTATQSSTVTVSSGTPAAPAKPTATAGVTSATVSWTTPASNGSAITGYVVSPYLSGAAQTPVSFDASATARTITGLTGGGSYTFTVAAVNANGTGAASPKSTAVTPYDVPSAPTITAATAGDSRATLSWTAGSNNGSAVTAYVVTPYIGGTAQTATTFASTATTQTVTGLTAGTAYTFKVAAQNAAGTGAQSAASSAVTPNPNPAVTSTSPPAGTVNSAYTYQLTVGGGTSPFTWSLAGGTLPAGLTLSSAGLISGTPTTAGSSTFTVQVSDASSQAATSSLTIVVSSTVPSAPAKPTATAGVTSATVSWTAPASNGSAITGYVVTPYLAGAAQAAVSFDASATSRTITGLTGGGSYTFTVAAVNANGTGGASPQSNAVTVTDVPAAPTITAATVGDQRVTLTWTAGSANGSAITGYVVTPSVGGTAQTATTFASTATSQTLTGLTAGTAYTFTVAAQNGVGTGPQSAASSAVTPNANPTLAFGTPPGGAVGTAYSYQLTVTGGTAPFSWIVSSGTLPAGLTLSAAGVISGTPTTVGSSTFTVQVSDANGQTATQSTSVTVTSVPAKPATPTATASLTSAVLTWTAPATNGSTITGYVITPYLGGVAQTPITVDPSAKTRRVNGLTAGSAYTFTVAAVNANGAGPASAASNAVTPYAALNAPTIGAVTAGTTSATVNWTAPTSTGGSAITGYVVTPYLGSTAQTPQTFTGTATTQTLTGLTPGTAYTFTVAALNNSGSTVLNRVSAEGVTATDGGADWVDDPSSRTGSSRVYHPNTAIGSLDGTVPSSTPPGLFLAERFGDDRNNELKYAIPVAAGTPLLVRLYFANTYPGTSSVGGKVFDVALDGSTVLPAFDPVAAAGGTSIATMRDFAVTSDGTVNIDFTYVRDNPAIYGIEILQTGTATTGPPSSASAAVTPNANPTISSTTPPAAFVGSAYSYQLTNSGGTAPFTWSLAGGTLPTGVTLSSAGLLSGTPTTVGSSTFTVQVADASGQTATQALTVAVSDRPGTVARPTATAGVTSATVSWAAPAANGSPITGYVVTPYLSGVAQTPVSFDASATSRTITGLTGGGSYTFTVAAVNAVGTGGASPQSSAVTVTDVPAAPTITASTAGDQRVTLTWTAGSANGSAITGYVVTPYIGGTAQTATTFASTATSQTITGLTAGTAYTFRVAAQNAAGTGPQSAASSAVTPNASPTVSTTSLPGGAVGSAYSSQLTVSGGTSPFTWSLSTGTLPAGLTLSSGGLISGTPTTVGSSTFTVQVSDASGQTATQPLTLTVTAVPAKPAIPTATAGLTSAVLTWTAPATNGSTITGYVITPYIGSTAQTPVTVDPFATTRTLNGLTAGSAYTFTVAAVNANGTSAASSASNSVTPYAALNAPTVSSVTAGTTSATLSWSAPTSTGGSPVTGYVVTPYIGGTAQTPQTFTGTATTRTVTGLTSGTAYTFRVAALNNSGTTALYRINAGGPQVAATDGGPDWAADPDDSILHSTGLRSSDFTGAATRTDTTVPSTTPFAVFNTERWDPNVGMSWALPVATGTQIKVRYYVAELYFGGPGSRSFNMTLDGTQVLSGFDPSVAAGGSGIGTMREFTTTSDGTVNLDFGRIQDNPIVDAIEVLQTGTSTTGPASSPSASVTPNDNPALTFAAPPSGEVGVGYSQQLTATGGTAPFTWSVSSGSLPAGLTLGASSGLLSGTPTSAGTYAFTVQVTDGSGSTATRDVSLVVAAQPSITFSPATGEVGVPYSQQPTLTGGTAPVAWSISAGSLPGGLSINTSTGLISGTPTASGTFSVTVRAVDAYSQVATRTASIVVAAAPTLTSTTPKQYQQAGFSFTFAATGGTGPFSYAVVSGTLPSGITLSSAGVLSGQTNQGSYPFTVRVTDAFGKTADDPTTLVVDAPPIQLVKTGSATSAVPGDTVTFTLTATNISSTFYGNTVATDPLADVLDDAAYNNDVAVTAGTVSYASSKITWAIPLNPGQSATLTYTVTVDNPDPGNKLLTGQVDATRSSTSCSAGQRTSSCTAPVTVSGLSVTTTANTASTTPGSTVSYSVVVANTGKTAYASTTVTQNLSGLLDDATYRGDAAATAGSVTYASPTLTWTGPLAVGASITISYAMRVNDPDTGNRSLTVTALSNAAGSTCPSGSPAASCSSTVPVLVPALSVTTAATPTSATPGDTVTFTMTLSNNGQTAYTGTSAALAITGALDDATYQSSSAGAGTVGYSSGTVTWTGDLAIEASVVVSVVVQVGDPDPGDRNLVVAASSAAAGSTCGASPGPACTTSVPVLVPGLTVTTAADVATTTPGSVVTYTVQVTNSGQTAQTGASVSVPLSGVLDDATYDNDVAGPGTVGYASSTISWTGDLAVGATATITYSVTVRDPDPGDRSLTSTAVSASRGSSCPPGGSDARCTTTVAVLVPALTITAAVDGGPTTTPGARLRYTSTVLNSGQTTYTGAVVVLDSRGVGDDATFGLDGTESSGTATPQPDGTLRWVLTLAPGQSATATATFVVNDPPTGDRVLTSTTTSSAPGSSCPTGSSPGCSTSVTVLVPGLTLSTTADSTSVTPGDTIRYTVVATNTGETTYAPATVTDNLSAVTTDAVYNNDATATTGTPVANASTLTWTGPLAVGASVTITFTVTVRDPDPGDKQVVNRVSSTDQGSTCSARSTTSACTASVSVAVPGLTIVAAAGVASTMPGATVTSTVTVTNSGATAYPAASFSLPLGDVFDDADLAGSPSATSGTALITGSTLGWSGALAVGASATITYSVTVHAADGGSNRLLGTVTSTSRGTNCASGSADSRCTTNVPVARLVLERVPRPPATTTPGSALDLSVRFTNAGQVPYTGITVDIPRADSSDDLFATSSDVPSSGTLLRTTTTTQWAGDIAVGQTVTVTILRTVRDPDTGNRVVTAPLISTAPGSNCPTEAATDPRCSFETDVLIPGLTITKTANTTATVAGGSVTYTITAANTGQTPYTGATFADDLSGVLDDATFNGSATADVGAVSYSGNVLTWTGDLTVGQTATITYTVVANAGTGDKTMTNIVSSSTAGSNCPAAGGATACRSTVAVLTPGLAITQTSDLDSVTFGSPVTYTVQVRNSGQTPYSSAAFSTDLSHVLDDATWDPAGLSADRGTIGYTSGLVSWSGALAPGATATITYRVVVQNPDPGDQVLTATAVSTNAGSNCQVASVDTRCTATVAVVNAVSLTFSSAASVRTTAAGQVVAYTVTATNSTESELGDVAFTESLAGILDDADYGLDVAADHGTATVSAGTLSWLGSLDAGATATITFSVTVHATATGDSILTGTVVSESEPNSDNCVASSGDPRCTTTVPVAALVINQAYTELTTTPGSLIHLTATFTNTGQAPYEGITIFGASADTLDDAVASGDQHATSGQLVLNPTAIVWTGDIPVGGSVTVTGSLTVKRPDPGNKAVTGTLATTAAGSNCPTSGGSDPRCTALSTVLVPQLSLSTSADVSSVIPGQTATYTVLIANTGQTPYTGATVTDSLAGVVDDASFDPAAVQVSSGSVSYAGSALTWTGNLAVGQTVTVTVPARALANGTGDKAMRNDVSSAEVGSTCLVGSSAAGCEAVVSVLTPALTFTSAVNVAAAKPGDVVTTTVTVSNTGQTSYTGATFSIDLTSGVLDDATYGGGAASSPAGTVGVTAGVLHWSGDLAVGDSATITYTVTVNSPDTGDFRLDQTVLSTELGSTCAAGSTDPRCTTSVPIAYLHMSDVTNVSTVAPLGVVRFTETYTNPGQVPLYGVHITIDGRDTFDDATYNGDATPSSGSLTLDPATGLLTWSGDIAVGQSVTTMGSVTVKNPTPGNKHLRTRISTDEVPSNCPSGTTHPECLIDVRVLTPGLSIVTTPGASTTTPGSAVGYTTTLTNTGETAYTGITVTDDLSGVLDDTGGPTGVGASSGQAVVNGSTLTWTGDLAIGASVTISYMVRVRDPDPGDLNLVNNVSSDAIGSSCPTGGGGSGCSSLVTVLIPALSVAVTADTATAYPGAVVTYTLTVTNTGQTDYAAASATVGLAGVLDDATYTDDAVPSTGSVSYAAPSLTWTGALAVGASAVTTYTVTVKDPDPGNRSLLTTVSSAAAGSSCPTTAPCSSSVVVQIPALSVSTTADTDTATPGQRVTYTITIHNTGQRAYLSTTTTTASLAGVLDDASLRGGFQASSGMVSYNAPNLTWTGLLPLAGTVTIAYTVRVEDPDTGDRVLTTSVANQSSGSTCPAGSTSSLCRTSVEVLVPALTVGVSAADTTTTPGSSESFSVVITNSGETDYAGAVVTTSLASVLDDADYGGDARVTAGPGDVGYAGDVLTWTGDLPVGASATVQFTVLVHDPDTGDKLLAVTSASTAPGSTCASGDANGCSASVQVLVPALDVRLLAEPDQVAAAPGQVAYYLFVDNTGETDYAAATAKISLAGVLDDATLDPADVSISTGSVDFSDQTLTLTAPIPVGGSAFLYVPVRTNYPATGDKSMDATVVDSDPGSTCPQGSSNADCSTHTVLQIPKLDITTTASATHVVAGQSLTYTVTATNNGEFDFGHATFDDDLSGLLAHATYNGDATASTGDVSMDGGVLTWGGPLVQGETVVFTFSVTVAPDPVPAAFVLANQVVSATPGSNCGDGSADPACSASTTVDASTLTLSGLTSGFTLTGLPGDTVTLNDAVVGTVVTNNLTGYTVTVQAAEAALVGGRGNPDSIPVDRLQVRVNGSSTWTPLSATAPVTVGGSDSATSTSGDAISYDAQIQIPEVNSDTYSGELDYIVGTQ